ncbi:MAG: hypothetical protein AAF587_43915 [Bacteroidota bacterium]
MDELVVVDETTEIDRDIPENRIISFTHPLSIKNFVITPITVGNCRVITPDILFWACKLTQHNFFHEAQNLLSERKYLQGLTGPETYVKSVFEKYKALPRAVWLLNRSEVLYAILRKFISEDNIFSRYVSFIAESFDYGSEFIAITASNEKRFSSGFSLQQCQKQAAKGFDISVVSPGNNIYGRVTKRIILEHGNLNPPIPSLDIDRLLTTSQAMPNTSYTSTVGLIGDSTFQCAYHPEGGRVITQPNATCQVMIDYLNALRIHLNSFHVIIFCLGTFDAMQLDEADQSVALWSFYEYIKPLVNHPSVVLIFNTGIGTACRPDIPEYSEWFLRTLQNWIYTDSGVTHNIHYCDWSEHGPMNPFIDEDRNIVEYYMLKNERFPNKAGLQRMLQRWIELYPSLGNIEMRFGGSWPYGSLLNGAQQVQVHC